MIATDIYFFVARGCIKKGLCRTTVNKIPKLRRMSLFEIPPGNIFFLAYFSSDKFSLFASQEKGDKVQKSFVYISLRQNRFSKMFLKYLYTLKWSLYCPLPLLFVLLFSFVHFSDETMPLLLPDTELTYFI